MQIFTKANAIKLLAILVVLFFLFETFSIYSTPRGANIPVDTGTGTDTSTQNQSTSLFGIAVANATVVSYGDSLGPSINVAGNSSELQQTIGKLKSEGIVTYTSPSQGGITLNLARGTNVSEVAKRDRKSVV